MDVFAQFLKLRSNKVKHDAGVWMMGSSEDALRTRQDEVQRLLGQCLLGLQAYERLMKAIVAHHDISGSFPSLERTEAGRAAVVGRKTLGTLVNELIESFLTTDAMASSSAASPEPF